jgi:hypothetical protein
MLEQDDYLISDELGLETLNPFLACNISEETDDEGEPTGKMLAILTVQDDFRFHRDLDREKGNPHNQLFTLEDRPTEAVISVLRNLVDERYHGENFQLDDTGTEWFQFDIVLTVDPETTPEDLGGKFWEDTELVRFHNEADPGTFNSPYLFGSLVYDGLRELDQ